MKLPRQIKNLAKGASLIVKCVPHLPTVIHPLFKALDGKVYRANITNVLPFEIEGKYIIEEPVIVEESNV